jgi:hypothetical protein
LICTIGREPELAKIGQIVPFRPSLFYMSILNAIQRNVYGMYLVTIRSVRAERPEKCTCKLVARSDLIPGSEQIENIFPGIRKAATFVLQELHEVRSTLLSGTAGGQAVTAKLRVQQLAHGSPVAAIDRLNERSNHADWIASH